MFLGSSSMVLLGVTYPASLKVIGCREALALAADLALHNVIITSDSKQLLVYISCGP